MLEKKRVIYKANVFLKGIDGLNRRIPPKSRA